MGTQFIQTRRPPAQPALTSSPGQWRAAMSTVTQPHAAAPSSGVVAWNLDRIPAFAHEQRQRQPLPPPDSSLLPFIQRKVTLGLIDDPLEADADRVAEQIMRMPDRAASPGRDATSHSVMRRAGPTREHEPTIRMEAGRTGDVARAQRGAPAPALVQEVPRRPGQPLDAGARAFLEPRFGHDFSRVRVHADAHAAASARAINALAYTSGRDIVFGQDQYAPATSTGRRLLAHELTHTVQQGASTVAGGGLVQRAPDDSPQATNASSVPEAASGGMSEDTNDPYAQSSDEELAQIGLIALGNALRRAAEDTGRLRQIYNEGANRILAEIARKRAAGVAEQEIAEWAAGARHALAEQVREIGGALLRKGAEAFDAVRGNVGRPTYQSLINAGKTDAEIIASAAKTNRFINRLPAQLEWTGQGIWLVAVGMSIYVVVTAPAEETVHVATQEAAALGGGALGTAAGEGLCVAFGIATEGIGLFVCGLLGGLIGMEGGRAGVEVITQTASDVGNMTPAQWVETTTQMFGTPQERQDYYKMREIETGEPDPLSY